MKTTLDKTILWEVEEQPVIINGAIAPNSKAILRSDNHEILSVKSGRYKLFKNDDLMTLAEKICDLANFEVAGYAEFMGGKKMLAYLQNKDSHLYLNGEKLKEYMLIGNTHDGSGCVFIGTANCLIRCTNQFSQDLRILSERHVGTMNFDSIELKKIIESYVEGRDELYHIFERMKSIPTNTRMREGLITHLLNVSPENKIIYENTNIVLPEQDRESLLRNGIQREMNAVGENVWGLFNGVTWYTSHDIKTNRPSLGNVAGLANVMNKKAFEYCTKLIQN